VSERVDAPRDLVFVGGTGRSGTHVVARLLGSGPRYRMVPVEARFHCNPRGLADVVTGQATPEEFVTKLRRFWWHRVRLGGSARIRLARIAGRGGGKVRGLHKIIAPDRFEEAVGRFEASCGEDVVLASRQLFLDLLWPLADEAGKPGLVEMSCFTIASAPGLERMFPEARFVHALRDGRDSGSSKASKRQKEHHPTGVVDGIDWWLDRLRMAEEGIRGMEKPERVLPVSLDDLVAGDREGAYGELNGFLGLDDDPAMGEFFRDEMSPEAAHRERWRDGLDAAEQAEVQRRYEEALDQLEREGYSCAPVLRRAYERTTVSA
jgi:hypothetical protein